MVRRARSAALPALLASVSLRPIAPYPEAFQYHLGAPKFPGSSALCVPEPLALPCGKRGAGLREPAQGRPDSAFGQRLRGAVSPAAPSAPRVCRCTASGRWRVGGPRGCSGSWRSRTQPGGHPSSEWDMFSRAKRSLLSSHGGPPGTSQASVDIPSITNTYAGGEDKTPPFSPEVDSPHALSSPFFPKQPGSLSLELPARLPTRCLPSPPRSLVAPGESGGAGRREGTNGVATPREKLGGKRGVRRKGQSTRLGAPHSLPPPPPFRTGRGEGGSGGSRADVTAGRARPRRRRWEPLRAQRSGARPGAPDPPLPCLPPAAVCHALAGAGAPGERRELGLSPGTRLIGAEEPLSPQPPHPRRCLAGARAPFLVRKCHCPLCLGEAGERGLGSEGGGFGQGSVRELGWTERGGWGIPARPPWAAQAAGASLCRWGRMRGALPLRVGGRTQSSRAKGCGAVGSAQR